mgnify:CR=1 FL=1
MNKKKLNKFFYKESCQSKLLLYNTECLNGGRCARNGLCREEQISDDGYDEEYDEEEEYDEDGEEYGENEEGNR